MVEGFQSPKKQKAFVQRVVKVKHYTCNIFTNLHKTMGCVQES